MSSMDKTDNDKKTWIKPEIVLISRVQIESGNATVGIEGLLTVSASGETGASVRYFS